MTTLLVLLIQPINTLRLGMMPLINDPLANQMQNHPNQMVLLITARIINPISRLQMFFFFIN